MLYCTVLNVLAALLAIGCALDERARWKRAGQ